MVLEMDEEGVVGLPAVRSSTGAGGAGRGGKVGGARAPSAGAIHSPVPLAQRIAAAPGGAGPHGHSLKGNVLEALSVALSKC